MSLRVKVIASMVLAISGAAMAGEPALEGEPGFGWPVIEPGPVVAMSADAALAAQVLLNPALKDCVSKFQKHDTSDMQVDRQNLEPGHVVYVFRADVIKEGDIIAGWARIIVDETQVNGGEPGITIPAYDCRYHENILY